MRWPFGRSSEVAMSEAQAPETPREVDNAWDEERSPWSTPSFSRVPKIRVCHYCRKPFGGKVTVLFSGEYHCGCNPEATAESERQKAESRAKHAADLPLFDLHRACPKCGNEHRTAEIHEPAGPATGCLPDVIICPGGMWPHIQRRCGVCGFLGYELPLDFEP